MKRRSVLWLVRLLNTMIAVAFFVTGLAADSSSLIAMSLVSASDSFAYTSALATPVRSMAWKLGAARASGLVLVGVSIGVAIDALRRLVEGSDPLGTTMILMAVVAGIVNIVSLWLLRRTESPAVPVHTARPFTAIVLAANGSIVVGGTLVLWLGTNLPDLVIGITVAGVAVQIGLETLVGAHERVRGDVRPLPPPDRDDPNR